MSNHTARVLIVDDMPVNRMILSSLLATHCVLSDQAESGAECLQLCRNRRYDLILLDHRMPELDGVDTLVQLKALFDEKGWKVPVICHTTEEGREYINLYKAAGFADVLIKPINPRQLSDILRAYLAETEQPEAVPTVAVTKEQPPAEDDERDELDKLPLWLKTVPHIDLVAGIATCESAEDYVDALTIFRSSIESKADAIEHHLDNDDWEAFQLSVHSLKSMARLIGARSLQTAAAALEAAADEGDYNLIQRETPGLLSDYRRFLKFLAPLAETISEDVPLADTNVPVMSPEVVPEEDHSRSILLVRTSDSIITKGFIKNLQDADFTVTAIPDEPDLIINYRFQSDIILYYPHSVENGHIGLTMNLLGEVCQDDAKLLLLTGDAIELKAAMASRWAHRVSRCYLRPVDIPHFIRDMNYFSVLLQEYHRRKTIFIVDDDPDYLSVIEKWLSVDYAVSCFHNGPEILDGISAMRPDLILLDYEMPEMDGCELLKNFRTTPATQQIPVIFLTGKNDRDHVFHILEYKPDGYLLKSSRREALLDAIHRLFAETMFRKSLL
ncbi:MAG: response regulator [Butyrivibrio sp.]|nr:response regulator [Butyrivibrio sp.]